MPMFAVQLAFNTERNDIRLGVRPRHREYLTTLREQGTLVAAGPWGDDTGALLIYDVSDEAEVRTILDNDPYTGNDLYEIVELREWKSLFPLTS